MAIPINIKEDRRAWKRSIVLLKAKYMLNNVRRYKECIVIDISRQGACIKTPIENKISRGDSISLEISGNDTTNVAITAEIKWTKKIENGLLIGIQFETLLDTQANHIL